LLNAVSIEASRGQARELDYSIAGQYSSLSTTIGVSDNTYGSYSFQIVTDGHPVFSHTLKPGEQLDVPAIPLTGVAHLGLIVTTADGPYSGGIGVFANAQLVGTSEPPAITAVPQSTKLLADLSPANGEESHGRGPFSVGGRPLLNAVSIEASRGQARELDYSIAGQYSSLSTTIGVSDNTYGSYSFQIVTDGHPVFSHTLKPGEQLDVPAIPLTGVAHLGLIVTTADGPYSGGIGVFANAQVTSG
jgi:hypothetical protein